MSEPASRLSKTAAELRREFDRGFAAELAVEAAHLERMLAVRVGGDAYAIRLDDVAALFAGRRIAPLPSPMPDLLGIASLRGKLAAVYDLAAALGYPSRAAPRWLVLVRGRDRVALAFDVFEAQLAVPRERIVLPTSAVDPGRAHLHGAVQSASGVRPILDLPSMIARIQQRVQSLQHAVHSVKER